ncbi:MAG: hypothetical protein LBB14_01330 [Puniceicoccales bacterium]|jgi:hypothetical protein|nr:hypothetical protein [Puniceicoccales bacterium]
MADTVTASKTTPPNPVSNPSPGADDPNAPNSLGKNLLIAGTAVAAVAFVGTFTLWLALKVFGATVGAATAVVTAVMSWVVPVIILALCVLGIVWFVWFIRFKPAEPEGAPAAAEAAPQPAP